MGFSERELKRIIKDGVSQHNAETKCAIEDARDVIVASNTGGESITQLNTNNAAGDAFGRLRVSEPATLFDSKQLFDNQPLFWDDDEVSGGGTTTSHSVNRASTTIGVGATTAGRRLRQTYRRFNYEPGKSQLIFLTGIIDASGGGTGITRRMGLYDDNNGLFLEDEEGVINLVRRTYVTGAPVNNKVAQADWNIDTLDGNGSSGITLDLSKVNILVIDFEWLGVGRVRMGFNIDGVTYICHEFLHANTIDSVYMSTANLPLRYEIINDGTGAASTLEHICSSVMSEGGTNENGVIRSASTAGTHVDGASENTIYAVVGMRLKSAYIGTTVKLLTFNLALVSGSHKAEWSLWWNPDVAGTFTYGNETNSALQTAKGTSTSIVTNGYLIDSGFFESGGVQSGNAGSISGGVENALLLGSAIDGTVDEIVLAVRPIAGSTDIDVEGSLTWRELL